MPAIAASGAWRQGEADSGRIKILLIAYEFPPSPSPQSLRWMYLSRELARLGYQVDVLTCRMAPSGAGLDVPEGVRTHRTSPGGFKAVVARLRSLLRGGPDADHVPHRSRGDPGHRPDATRGPSPAEPDAGLNWKGRVAERMQARALGVAEGSPLLEIRRVAFSYKRQAVEWRISRVNTERYEYLGQEPWEAGA